MKYASEVMDLMAPYPGRQFRMAQIVRFIDPQAAGSARQRIHKGVLRVLQSLADHGQVEIIAAAGIGGFATYSWKVRHQVLAKWDRNHDNIGRTVAP